MDVSRVKELIERKIRRSENKIEITKMSHGNNPGQTHTYWGGWELGYWEGRLSVLEDILDSIEGESE